MAPIAKFVRRRTDSTITDQNTEIFKPSKNEPLAATEAYGDVIAALPSRSDSESKKLHRSKSSRCRSKNRHWNLEERHDNRQFHLSKSLKEIPDLQTDFETVDGILSMNKHYDLHPRTQDSGTVSDISADRHGRDRRTRQKDFPVIHQSMITSRNS